MRRIVWLPSMSVGIEKWDADHRVLLDLIDQLDHAVRGEAGAMGAGEALAVLAEYAELHFRSEETVMEKLEYPRLADHLREHKEMRAWIAGWLGQAQSGAITPQDLAEHLVHWLYGHILTIDHGYADFFENRRREVAALLADYPGLTLRRKTADTAG